MHVGRQAAIDLDIYRLAVRQPKLTERMIRTLKAPAIVGPVSKTHDTYL